MSSFIKLSGIIINSKYINFIKVMPSKYLIEFQNNGFNGKFIQGTGSFTSINNIIIICEKEHTFDYNVMKNWIKTNII